MACAIVTIVTEEKSIRNKKYYFSAEKYIGTWGENTFLENEDITHISVLGRNGEIYYENDRIKKEY